MWRRASAQATIAASGNLSGAVDLSMSGGNVTGIIVPVGWTAASITFQASDDGINFFNLYTSAGAEYSVAAVGGVFHVLNPADFQGLRAIKIRSGPSATPVAQTAQRILTLVAWSQS